MFLRKLLLMRIDESFIMKIPFECLCCGEMIFDILVDICTYKPLFLHSFSLSVFLDVCLVLLSTYVCIYVC